MEEEESFLASDAEPDSDWEMEDSERENELEIWLEQLNSFQQEGEHVTKRTPVNNRVTLTPKEVMENFRSTIVECEDGDGRDGDFGLDAILGELCQLETQLTTAQTEINSSLNVPEKSKPQTVSENVCGAIPCDQSKSHEDSFDALDLQLQSALSELSEIAGGVVENDDHKLGDFTPTPRYSAHSDALEQSRSLWCVTTNSELARGTTDKHKNTVASVSRADGGWSRKGSLDKINDSHHLDYGRDVNDGDCVFSDSASLPSSGSHLSVATTSSQQSVSSRHSVELTGPPGMNATASAVDETVLDENSENGDKKLFIRAYTVDGSSKSILIDEKMSVAQVCDILVAKNHASPSVHWSLVEHLPDLYMERILEDQDCAVGAVLTWTRDSSNKLLFEERMDKYNVFLHPELYLAGSRDVDGYTESSKQALIKEHFCDSNTRIPEVEGMLYLKSEGKKAWKKFHCVLRASGIYYTPKGKVKSSKDLVCLQKLDIVEVYSGLGWKKKYKAPTDYGFALKHPQIQRKGSKYIKYICADDERSMHQWLVGIRMAKLGHQLLTNYELVNNNLASWDSKEHNPNPRMSDFLEQQNQLNNRASFSDKIQGADQSYNNNNSFSDISSQDSHGMPYSHYSKAHSATKVLPSKNILSNVEACSSDSENNQCVEYATMSPKMKPFIPVTTSTLKQLTGMNQGTIKCSPKIYKKSKRSPRKEAVTSLPLPPEPMDNIVGMSDVDRLPPPPTMDDLRALHTIGHSEGRRMSEGLVSLTGSPGHSRTQSVGGSPNHSYASLPRPPLLGMYPTGAVKGGQRDGHYLPPSRAGDEASRQSHTVGLPDPPVCSPLTQSADTAHSLAVVFNSHSLPGSPAHKVSSAVQPPIRAQSSGHRRTSSVGNSRPIPPAKPKPPPPPKRSGQTHLSKSDSIAPVEQKRQPSEQTAYFFSDLQRVLGQKRDYANIRKRNILDPKESFPPPPPPQILPSSCNQDERDDVDDLPLPPPPAELLEDLRKMQNTSRKKLPPPPPPKRSSGTKLTTKH